MTTPFINSPFGLHPQILERRWRNSIRMLVARGYRVPMSFIDGPPQFYCSFEHNEDRQKKILLLWHPTKISVKTGKASQFRYDSIRGIVDDYTENKGVSHVIVVSNSDKIYNGAARKLLSFRIEFFLTDFFTLDPFAHAFSPVYRVTKTLPERVKAKDLAPIALNNPIVRYLDLSVGQFLEIYRDRHLTKGPDDLKISKMIRIVKNIDEKTTIQEEEAPGEDEDQKDVLGEMMDEAGEGDGVEDDFEDGEIDESMVLDLEEEEPEDEEIEEIED